MFITKKEVQQKSEMMKQRVSRFAETQQYQLQGANPEMTQNKGTKLGRLNDSSHACRAWIHAERQQQVGCQRTPDWNQNPRRRLAEVGWSRLGGVLTSVLRSLKTAKLCVRLLLHCGCSGMVAPWHAPNGCQTLAKGQ